MDEQVEKIAEEDLKQNLKLRFDHQTKLYLKIIPVFHVLNFLSLPSFICYSHPTSQKLVLFLMAVLT